MTARLSEPSFFPPPPPLLPRGMRPANPTMYTQRQQQQTIPAAQQYPSQQMVPPPMMTNGNLNRSRPTPPPPPPAPPVHTPPQEAPKQRIQLSEGELEKRIDKASIKGNFGWMTLDAVNIPCLFRNDEKYVSVRMVEQKLLSKYPSTYPDELRDRPPLKSQFITAAEAKLLNEINIEHCECEFGQQVFTEKDLIVSWPDFVDFYKIVKKHFPNENVAAKQRKSYPIVSGGGGWVQVNNTVVPYLKRLTPNANETLRLAPLPVIKYAAGLLTDTEVPCLEPTSEECRHLTDMCRKAGLDFKFSSSNTQLVLLSMIPAYSGTKVVMKKLPDDDPFASAEYCSEIEDEKPDAGTQCGVILPTMQEIPLAYCPRPPSNGHQFMSKVDNRPPPNVTVQRSSTVVSNAQGGMYSITRMERAPPMMNVTPGGMMGHHGSSSPALQALEQLSGPPMKRQKGTSTSGSSGPVPRTSPSQINGGDMMRGSPQAAGMAQQGFMPSMSPFPPVPFTAGNARMMPPPSLIPAGFAGWPPTPQHPGDMQKLAEMMNIQAAILSQARPVAPPMMPSPNDMMNQITSRKTNSQVSNLNQNKAPKQTISAAPEQASVKQKRKSHSLLEQIQPIDFHGKKISCLVKEDTNQQFALIEAISRVYFPQCSLDEFINAVATVLQISIYQLNRDEEKAFITFYGLPTESLKCNKVLNLRELDQFMPQMKYMFRDREQVHLDQTHLSAPGQPQPRISVEHLANQQQSLVAVDTNANPGGTNLSASVLPPPNPFKKTGTLSKRGALGKVASKLEDAVNRLRQNKMLELGGSSPGGSSSSDLLQNPLIPPRNPFDTNDSAPGASQATVTQTQ